MRLAFMGTPDFAVPSLAELIASGHEIVAVYSQPPRPKGRGQKLTPSPVHAFAEAMGLPEFDAAAFAAKVEEIQVPENGVLVFVFYDGHTVTKTWDNPSRRHSWNPENRQRARELALRQAAERRLAKCQQ